MFFKLWRYVLRFDYVKIWRCPLCFALLFDVSSCDCYTLQVSTRNHTDSDHGFLTLTLKVLNFWKFASYCSLKPLWSGMGEVVPARTLPTLHPPSPPTVHQLSWLAL